MKINTESKVGLFFLVGLAILGVITFKVENLGALMHRTNPYIVEFPHAANVKAGDTVAMAGVKVGEVKQVKLNSNAVQFILSVDNGVRIRRDSVASIAWGGLLGNRYIDLTLGTAAAGDLAPGEPITQITPTIEITEVLKKLDLAAGSLQEMFKGSNFGPKFSSLLDNLNKISEDISQQKGTIGKLVGSDEMYNKVISIADDLKGTSERISKLVKDNDQRINSIIENLEAAIPEAKDAFAAIKKLGEQANSGKGLLAGLLNDEQLYKDFKDSLSSLRGSLDKIESVATAMKDGKGLIGRLASDEQLAKDFGDTVTSMKNIAQRIDKGEGTLGKLTTDTELYDQAKKVLDDVREAVRSMREQVPVGTFASLLLGAF